MLNVQCLERPALDQRLPAAFRTLAVLADPVGTGSQEALCKHPGEGHHNLQCIVAPALKQNACPRVAAELVEVCSCYSIHLTLPGLQVERSPKSLTGHGERHSSPTGTWVLLHPHLRTVINFSGVADEESHACQFIASSLSFSL